MPFVLTFLFTFLLSCKTAIDQFMLPVESVERTFQYQIVLVNVQPELYETFSIASLRWYVATGIDFQQSDVGMPCRIFEKVVIDGEEVRGAVFFNGTVPSEIRIERARFLEGLEPASRTMTHELGHVLGLLHTPDTIMSRSTVEGLKISKEIVNETCLRNVCLWENPE